jgi:hypothetical protein
MKTLGWVIKLGNQIGFLRGSCQLKKPLYVSPEANGKTEVLVYKFNTKEAKDGSTSK